MSTCSVIVNVPEFPIRLGELCPQLRLATLASGLRAAGHETIVFDYATATHVDRFDTPALRRGCHRSDDRERERLEPLLGRARRDRSREIARQVAEMGPPDFVVYRIANREALKNAGLIRAILEELSPETVHVLAGEFIDQYGAFALPKGGGFACACTGDAEQTLPALADRLRTPARWGEVPGIHVDTLSVADAWCSTPLAEYPMPAYDVTTYPALVEGGKLRLFPFELCRISGPQAPVRVRNARAAVEELHRLSSEHGARGFVIFASDVPAADLTAFAQEIITTGFRTQFTLRADVTAITPREMLLLRQAGCLGIDVNVPTGSQHLLEDFYDTSYGVTAAEQYLRAARDAGLFVSLRLNYPAPGDDRHTRAETLRMLRRTRPDSVSIVPVELSPQMPWFNDPAQFGFGLERSRLEAWIHSDPHGAVEVPYAFLGGDSAMMSASRARFVEEVAEDGFLIDVRPEEVLGARLLYQGLPASSGVPRIREAIEMAQGDALLRLVEEFNAALPGIAHRGLRPFLPVLEAVGN